VHTVDTLCANPTLNEVFTVMAVNNIGNTGTHQSIVADALRNAAKPTAPTTQREESTPNSGGDTLSLTGTARQLRALQAQLTSQPIVDSGRVQSVRNELSSGTFVIDPPKVAQKMLDIETMINQKLFA